MKNRTFGEKCFGFFNTIIMLCMIAITLYPMIYVFFSSISNPGLLMSHQGLLWFPKGFSLDAYKRVFENPMITLGYRNTLFYVIMGTSINLVMTTLGAYVLSRKNFLLKKFMMFMIIFTMFFSGGMIPFYLLVRNLGLYDRIWSVIIPPAINTWNLIIMRTYFTTIPDSMEESARIDGANDLRILINIIVPLSMPVIAVMILFYGVERWNAWFYAMIFLRTRELYPLQLILRDILINASMETMTQHVSNFDRLPVSQTIKYAAIIVATLPILFVYPFLQKYFVQGVMIGALKE